MPKSSKEGGYADEVSMLYFQFYILTNPRDNLHLHPSNISRVQFTAAVDYIESKRLRLFSRNLQSFRAVLEIQLIIGLFLLSQICKLLS